MRSPGEQRSCEMPRREPASYSCRDLKVRLVHHTDREKKQRKRQEEHSKRGRGFEAADAWYHCGYEYEQQSPLHLSVDGIACWDCIMCSLTYPQNPPGVAR